MSELEEPTSHDSSLSDSTIFDVLVIGAGPTGLACAIEAKRAGFRTVSVDKGCLCNSLFHYPSNMTFFTTPELLEIGDIPFSTTNQKPNRNEALEYYRKVAEHYELDIRQYQRVEGVSGQDGDFRVNLVDQFGRKGYLRARKLIVSTGYYDRANPLNAPGEDLAKGQPLLHRPPPLLRSGCAGDRREEFRGYCCPGFMAAWSASHAGASRAIDPPAREVLDFAGHPEPHQEWRGGRLL